MGGGGGGGGCRTRKSGEGREAVAVGVGKERVAREWRRGPIPAPPSPRRQRTRLAHKPGAAQQQLRKDAACGPDVDRGAVAGGAVQQLGGAVPAGKHLHTQRRVQARGLKSACGHVHRHEQQSCDISGVRLTARRSGQTRPRGVGQGASGGCTCTEDEALPPPCCRRLARPPGLCTCGRGCRRCGPGRNRPAGAGWGWWLLSRSASWECKAAAASGQACLHCRPPLPRLHACTCSRVPGMQPRRGRAGAPVSAPRWP